MEKIISVKIEGEAARKAEEVTGEKIAKQVEVLVREKTYNGFKCYVEIVNPIGVPANAEFAYLVLQRCSRPWFNQKMLVYAVPSSVKNPEQKYFCYEFRASIVENGNEAMHILLYLLACTNFSGRGMASKEAMDRLLNYLGEEYGIDVREAPASDLIWALV